MTFIVQSYFDALFVTCYQWHSVEQLFWKLWTKRHLLSPVEDQKTKRTTLKKSTPKYVETYCAHKFDKFDKIDNNNLKIDNNRLLTTYPFIDFYRFPIQLTNFIDFINCYRLSVLSIELVRFQALRLFQFDLHSFEVIRYRESLPDTSSQIFDWKQFARPSSSLF